MEELPEKHTYLTLENQIPLQIYKTAKLHLKRKTRKWKQKKLIPITVTSTKYCPGMLLIPTSQTVLIHKCPLTCLRDERQEILNVQMSLSLSNLSLAPWVNNQSFSNNNYAVATLWYLLTFWSITHTLSY